MGIPSVPAKICCYLVSLAPTPPGEEGGVTGGVEQTRTGRDFFRAGAALSIDVARQHFALADMVGGADDAFGFHALDDAGGAVVADLQVALDEAGRGLALAADQRHRVG